MYFVNLENLAKTFVSDARQSEEGFLHLWAVVLPKRKRMFIVFWDTGSHILQSDPNNNSDSTALFGDELKSDPYCSSRLRSISGAQLW